MSKLASALLIGLSSVVAAADEKPKEWKSHPPMRPLPEATRFAVTEGPKKFVDAARGDDDNAGTEAAPWKSLAVAVRRLSPGETLYLRGGVYYEKVALTQSGRAEAPITISSYPGELAIIDGGLREFFESPETSWTPVENGAPGEFVSTKTYPEADARRAPSQFLPGSWEPMWGKESERPLALGNFGDSMIPLHGYRALNDLRATSENWPGKADPEAGFYAGPGLWFNRATSRIHVRLAHQKQAGLGSKAYRGESDPRKLPLVIAAGFGEDVFRATGIEHVRLHGLVFRGATGSPMISVYGSKHVTLDHVTVYGGFPGLMINASQQIKVAHSAFRGLAAPWTGRSHMKYRGTASYQIVLQNGQPYNEEIEFAYSEFTDDHDFAFFRFAKNLHFHHSFIDNFNDDGFECGPKLRWHKIFIHQNRIGACLSTFTQHEIDKDESPLDHNSDAGVYACRNIIDGRAGVQYHTPSAPDPTGDFLRAEAHLVGDHGGPVWPLLRFYQNTFVRRTPVFRDYYLFGLGAQALRNTERDVFNNIFLQMKAPPGVTIVASKTPEKLREGGNILWGLQASTTPRPDPFARFRASPLFKASQEVYPPGWTTQDRFIDPKFVRTAADEFGSLDLRLQADSPAVNTGVPIPEDWPDPLSDVDEGPRDIGALPLGATPWTVGVDGRIPLFGEPAAP